MAQDFSIEQFLISLQETIEFCNTRLEMDEFERTLRSIETYPHPFQVGFNRIDAHSYVVDSVIAKRHKVLENSRGENAVKLATTLEGGRLLAYQPDATVSDGASQTASGGFFDVYDTPPWDTWVMYVAGGGEVEYGYVVGWVPATLIQNVDKGIGVVATDCIWWLDSRPNELADALRGFELP